MRRPDWHDDSYPELREEPPWVMEEMIAAGPGLVEPILGSSAAGEVGAWVRAAASAADPVVVTGCGTSEHGAAAIAELLDDALRSAGAAGGAVETRQALEAALDPRAGGVAVAVSHEGATRATVLALEAARAAGARTVLVTAVPASAAAAAADLTLATPLVDRSWCHTVAYVSAILAGAAVASHVRGAPAPSAPVRALLEDALALREPAARAAERLASAERLVVCGTGADRVSARELALKIEEGARIPAAAHDLETLLHGHLVACGPDTGLVLVLADGRGGERRRVRGSHATQAAGALGMPVCELVASADGPALGGEPAPGRLVLPPAAVDDPLAALAGGAVGLQLLALALAHARGVNPDLIRREEGPYRAAAAAAEDPVW